MILLGYNISLRNAPLRVATFATGILAVLWGSSGQSDLIPSVTAENTDHYFGLTSASHLSHIIAVKFDPNFLASRALDSYNHFQDTLTAGACGVAYEPNRRGEFINYPAWDDIYTQSAPDARSRDGGGMLELKSFSYKATLYRHTEQPVLEENEKCLKGLINGTVSDVQALYDDSKYNSIVLAVFIFVVFPIAGFLLTVLIPEIKRRERAEYMPIHEPDGKHRFSSPSITDKCISFFSNCARRGESEPEKQPLTQERMRL